ncbi:hypothetical protein TRVL_07815 [Trypanosoma vivax]|nr:hypothetical protein TRVL_07815 [Trypanosoma vivax]
MLNKKSAAKEDAGMTVRQRLRQKRELEEKRKFGLAPLCVDPATGQEISPNVPQLISQAPWYYGCDGPTLAHQRQQHVEEMDTLNDKRDTVTVLGAAKTYVAGACGNCGSRTHKTNECYKPRKKVGAMYSGKVSGVDMLVERVEKTYAQKRDRFATASCIDLLQQVSGEEDGRGEEESVASGGDMEARLRDIFATKTAVSASSTGVAIKELPKHLHNLDNEGILFDPKTGSMRGNPNAADPTRTFQGDLERYRTGDYYTYLEMQLRFLRGETASIVDFKLDEELQKKKRRMEREGEGEREAKSDGHAGGDGGNSEESVRDRLVRTLYGEATLASAESSLRMKEALAAAATTVQDTPTTTSASALTASAGPKMGTGKGTRNGHAYVFGSYFDPLEFRWGYKCCKRLGKGAESCQVEASDTLTDLVA